MIDCPECDGVGWITVPCFICDGVGECGFCDDAKEVDDICLICNGTGQVVNDD